MKVRYKFNEISTELTHVHLSRDDEWLSVRLGTHKDFKIMHPFESDIDFYRDEKSVHLNGSIRGEVVLSCVGCLEEFSVNIDHDFQSLLFNAPSADTTNFDEAELNIDTINEEYLPEGVLDLEDVVVEELLLSIPDYPRCMPACKGLCPVCGANLNKTTCNCSKKEPDSPFSSLKNLLNM